MTDIRRQIERLLTDIKLAIDEARTIDEDPNMREAVSDICAYADREVDVLMLEANAGLGSFDVMLRLEGLRQELERRLELH